MLVAAIDISPASQIVENYFELIHKVLAALTPPIQIIHWSNKVYKNETYHLIDKSTCCFDFKGYQAYTDPASFLKKLPEDEPIDLYIFTSGAILNQYIKGFRSTFKRKSIQLSKVNIYYLGEITNRNLRFTTLFKHLLQPPSNDPADEVKLKPICFDNVGYQDIMKDDSLKATILTHIKSPEVDNGELKKEINDLLSRETVKNFVDGSTFYNFYRERDVNGAISYVKRVCSEKSIFDKKMSDILNLFDNNVSTHYLYTLNDDEEEVVQKEIQKPLEYECFSGQLENFYCIPIKVNGDSLNTPYKPFCLLESNQLVQKVAGMMEPMQFIKDISPFSREDLKNVYLLHNDRINFNDTVKHNNLVLSSLFQNQLPENPLAWHIIFLYIAATQRFPAEKHFLFKEIRFLGEHAQSFLSSPTMIRSFNCCAWYVACICHKVFPNSKENVLRNTNFVSGAFLKFYRHIYNEDYKDPEDMALWQLCHKLNSEKHAIFNILSHYYYYEKVGMPGEESPFQIILYRKTEDVQPFQKFEFLSKLNLNQVLRVYAQFLKTPNVLLDMRTLKDETVDLYDESEEKEDDLLNHVVINVETCYPFVYCPVTKKYWENCIGEYNRDKHSYLRLFQRYCKTYKRYPENGENLIYFLNKYIYEQKGGIPEIFSISLRKQMKEVMKIFEDVRYLYTCDEYLWKFCVNECVSDRYENEKKLERKWEKVKKMNEIYERCSRLRSTR